MTDANSSAPERSRVGNRGNPVRIEINREAVVLRFEPDAVRSSPRPGDISTPQGHKTCLTCPSAPVNLKIVDVSRKRSLVIADSEKIIAPIVRESQNQTAVVR